MRAHIHVLRLLRSAAHLDAGLREILALSSTGRVVVFGFPYNARLYPAAVPLVVSLFMLHVLELS